MGRDSPGSETNAHHLHDHSTGLFDNFPGLLFELSFWPAERRWGRVGEIHYSRLGATGLLSDPDHPSHPRLHDLASGDYYCYPRFASAIRSAPSHRPIYDADMALCFGYRRDCLFYVVPMVPFDSFRRTEKTLRVEGGGLLGGGDGKIVFVLAGLSFDGACFLQ